MTLLKPGLTVTVAVTLATLLMVAYAPERTSAAGTLTVTGVAANHSSVKIYFNPVSGAKDYRVYDVTNPSAVKYAGLMRLTASSKCPGGSCGHHFVMQSDGQTPVFPYRVASGATGGPQALDVPATSIDWNNVGDGLPHTVIVEAVDRLGPVPFANLYSGDLTKPLANPAGMLGSNKGNTADGRLSTNGQGPHTNDPQVIASSLPFIVQANTSYTAIPSKGTATQTFFDTFETSENATLRQTARNDTTVDSYGNLGTMTYTLNSGTAKAWEIEFRQSDNLNSMPFISSDHFMNMLFDGATPGTSAPAHTIYASMAMTPSRSFDISNGRVLHLTMEVDSHWSIRRWLAFNVSPASDPLKSWSPGQFGINSSNQGIFLEIKEGACTMDIFTGSTSSGDRTPTGTAGGEHGARLWGQWVPIWCYGDEMYVPANFSNNGLGLDDKSRLDFFLSATRAALFQDGKLIVQSAIPQGSFPWSNVPLKAYFTHYLYHSENDVDELRQFMCFPMNAFWFNHPLQGTSAGQTNCGQSYPPGFGFQNSDERHWDNMGGEVLQASDVNPSDFSNLLSLVQPPLTQAPTFGSGPARPLNLRIIAMLEQLRSGWAALFSRPAPVHLGAHAH